MRRVQPAINLAGLRRLDQYRVLYFATHGLLPGELHCQAQPGLVLSPPLAAARNTEEDGLLEAGEVATLNLTSGTYNSKDVAAANTVTVSGVTAAFFASP